MDNYFWEEKYIGNMLLYLGITPQLKRWSLGIMLGKQIDVSIGFIHFGIWF